MRVAGIALLLVACAFAQTPVPKHQVTAGQILALYRKAVGLDELAQLHNFHIKASVSAGFGGMWNQVGDMEGCYDFDGRMWERTEFTGRYFTWGYDGQKYWMSERNRSFPAWWNAEEKPDLPHIPFSSPFLPFPGLDRNPDDRFELLGVSAQGQRKAFVIRVTHKSGYAQNLYFDSQTYYLVRTEFPTVFESGSDKTKRGIVRITTWSAYKPFGKLTMPTKIEMSATGDSDNRTIVSLEKVNFDVKFDSKKYMGPR